MSILEIVLGVVGGGLMLLIGKRLLGGGSPPAPPRHDQGAGRAADRLAEAARSGAARASQEREAADDAAVEEIRNLPTTDDPVADLRARLARRRPVSNPRGDNSRPD